MNIRPARETDSPFIAWVELAAARSHRPVGVFDLAFPGESEVRLNLIDRITHAEPKSICHWSGFLVAEVEGEPAAALSGYEPSAHHDNTFGKAFFNALREADWSEEEIQACFMRMAPSATCMPDPDDDTWIIEWVATRADFRGRGLAAALLNEILEEGRRRGYQKSQISLLIGNDGAQRVYSSAGFAVFDEVRHESFEAAYGSPGVRRMRRDL